MRTLTVYGQRLAARAGGLPPLAVDTVIAAVCWINVVLQAAVDQRLQWWVPIMATANSLPLLWRRRHPFWVTMIIGVGTTWLALAGVLGDLPPAQLVATYTFAALCPPTERLIAVAGTVVGISMSILIPEDEVLNLGPVGIAFAVAYALGTGARARRDRIAMLEERARRLDEEQDAAAARERQRIAREMHDIIAHSMSMIAIQAEAGPVAVRSDPDKAEQVFDTISATARDALAQLRRALGVLRSDEWTRRPQPGLETLPTLVADVRNTGLAVTLHEDGRPRQVSPDLAVTAYRVVQESLTNTVKHAAASSVQVRLGWRDDALRLEVCDDGRGLAGAGDTGGHGLVGMRERVAAVGGELTLEPGPDGMGLCVVASLPVP
ncbi:sensor histidine kinase [Actinomadura sp. HBU206391]|uniref:sensor histidine kinase n=1 Tax=Actinomadura sp. HBU206391 TaxID=2731692 RepID=UPI00164F9AD5|nr:sensor histidine kinase [Actinomadura sp. HBU206391]MBC6462558.1 sensor histidine kinase [Actinomadura sp. HBU206391]